MKSPAVKILLIGDPSVFVIVHVRGPQVVKLPTLVKSVSDQLRTPAALLMLYDKAGVENLDVLIFSVSVKHGH